MAILKTKQQHYLVIEGRDIPLSDYDVDQLRRELVAAELDWRVQALRGLKIDAIKIVRGELSLGLKEAKDIVELFCAERGNRQDEARALLARVDGGTHFDEPPDDHEDIPF